MKSEDRGADNGVRVWIKHRRR